MVVAVCSSEEEFQALAMRFAARVLLPGTGWTAFTQLMDLVCYMENQVCWNLTIHQFIQNRVFETEVFCKLIFCLMGGLNSFFLIVKYITRLVCLKIKVDNPFLYFLGIDFQLLRGCLCGSSAYSLKQARQARASVKLIARHMVVTHTGWFMAAIKLTWIQLLPSISLASGL